MSEKNRHGCLTAYLALLLVFNSLTALIYFVVPRTDPEHFSVVLLPSWAFPLLGIGSLLNLVSAIAIFKWKKWGFGLYVLSAFSQIVLNFYLGLGVGTAIGGLVGVAILYGVLQIGGDRKGWTQLD